MTDTALNPEIAFAPKGQSFISLIKDEIGTTLRLGGEWTIENAAEIDRLMPDTHQRITASTLIDVSGITKLDTTGAVLVRRYAEQGRDGTCALVRGLTCPEKRLLDVITSTPPDAQTEPDLLPWGQQTLIEIGKYAEGVVRSIGNLLGFIGLTLQRFFLLFLHPERLRLAPLVHQFELTGIKAMGIVGMISFLTGAVMVNQGSIQLAKFGADIFVIDMLAILQFRELGLLLTAIIIAGRSGSSFTAQIGSMKLREEVDAMVTLGMNPVDVLVLPRLIALMIALPLLTFFADICGITGGIIMAWVQLDITPASFVSYFQAVTSVDDFMVGLMKAPFCALVIVVCGCYRGLAVHGSAESLGANTTRSVVESIFLVIVLDAFFAVFFTTIGI